MDMRTITLSMEDTIQGYLGSGIGLLIGLPNICLPQLILFCERRNDIKVATKGVLNIRFRLAFVTSVYTHNLTESLEVGGIKSLNFVLLSDHPTSSIFPFPLWGNHQSNVIFAVSAARLRGEEYKM